MNYAQLCIFVFFAKVLCSDKEAKQQANARKGSILSLVRITLNITVHQLTHHYPHLFQRVEECGSHNKL